MGVAPRAALGGLAISVALLMVACPQGEPPPQADGSPGPSPAPPEPPPSPDPGDPRAPALRSIGDFDQPVYVTAPPGDPRVFVVEQTGRIKVLGSSGAPKVFLDLSGRVSASYEQGLLSLAFSPDYERDGLAYVNYTDSSGDTRVVEYHVSSDPDRLDESTAREVLFVEQPFANHNGGLLVFDASGMLIVGLGDGGSAGDPGNRAQDLSTLLGKLLRIDPRNPAGGRPYGIPSDNPFVGRDGARPEIWAYGLRNPWRFSFDSGGDLYIGDVGQSRFEEVDWVPPARQAGANYGWRAFEGPERYSGERVGGSSLVAPVLAYRRTGGRCAVTGGYVYRGSLQRLRGTYLYADHCIGRVRGFRVVDGHSQGDAAIEGLSTELLSSFGVDAAGEMYVTSLSGPVFKIVPR